MSQYFIFRNNQVSEPIGMEALKQMAGSGEITEQHLISVDGGDWVKAGSIRELFPESNIEMDVIKTPEPPQKPPPPVTPQTGWFYAKDGQTVGPMPEEVIRELAQAGGITAGDFVWMSGQAGAIPAAQAPLLADIFQSQRTIKKKSSDRRDDNSKPISSLWLGLSFWIAFIGLPAFEAIMGSKTMEDVLSAENPPMEWIAVLLLLTFALLFSAVIYFYAFYRCWRKVHLSGDTRWPSPRWVAVLAISSLLVSSVAEYLPPIMILIPVIGFFTEIQLGQRIESILTRIATKDDLTSPSRTTNRAYISVIVGTLCEFYSIFYSPPIFTGLDWLLYIATLCASYFFIKSAVADVNRFSAWRAEDMA